MKDIELLSETIKNLTVCARRGLVSDAVPALVVPELEKSFSQVSAQKQKRPRRSSQSRAHGRRSRYQHPHDPTKTWSGRGRKPRWLCEEEAADRELGDFLVVDEGSWSDR